MFNRRDNEPDSPGVPPSVSNAHSAFSVLGTDVIITGNIRATADLHIDGQVDGDVDCASLVQGTESRIAGSVRAESARLAGTTEGSVSVRQLVIERAAKVHGDIVYEAITIEAGATINGHLKHVSADAAGRSARAPIVAPAPKTEPAEDRLSLVHQDGEAA